MEGALPDGSEAPGVPVMAVIPEMAPLIVPQIQPTTKKSTPEQKRLERLARKNARQKAAQIAGQGTSSQVGAPAVSGTPPVSALKNRGTTETGKKKKGRPAKKPERRAKARLKAMNKSADAVAQKSLPAPIGNAGTAGTTSREFHNDADPGGPMLSFPCTAL